MGSKNQLNSPESRGPLGQYLWDLRQATGMSLREVEEASEVSNAYVSQLETGKISQPSPAVLHQLTEVFAKHIPKGSPVTCSFERMMQLAGHIVPSKATEKRKGRLPTFVKEELTKDEEEELLKYLAFIRMRRGKS
jgi:transcriptional regulator with XRE-family HTH domain